MKVSTDLTTRTSQELLYEESPQLYQTPNRNNSVSERLLGNQNLTVGIRCERYSIFIIQGLFGAGKSLIIRSVIKEFLALNFCKLSQVFILAYNTKVTSHLQELLLGLNKDNLNAPMTYFNFTGLPILKLNEVADPDYLNNKLKKQSDDVANMAVNTILEEMDEIDPNKNSNVRRMKFFHINKIAKAMIKNLVNAELIIVNEYTTFHATEGLNLDMQLQYLKNEPNRPFGGVAVLFFRRPQPSRCSYRWNRRRSFGL